MIPELSFDDNSEVLKIKFTEPWIEEVIPEFFSRMRAMLDGRGHRNIIGDVTDAAQQKYTKKFRQMIADESESLNLDRVAILGANPVLKMMAKVLLAVIGKKLLVEANFFSKEDDAFEWLKGETE